MDILVYSVWGGISDIAFLPSFQVIWMLLAKDHALGSVDQSSHFYRYET